MNQITLPIESCLNQIKEALNKCSSLILTAEPGAGKSTVVPLALLNEPWLKGKSILMLQPRRVAAAAVADRMSQLNGTPLGGEIGYRVRFKSVVSSKTRIEVLTEGILTARLQRDLFLEDVGLVIFDEFHERSIQGDLGLALCREIQKEVRPDLRILIMSATFDTETASAFMPEAEVIKGKGFLYPVEIEYRPVKHQSYMYEVLGKEIAGIVNSSDPKDEYLVFLPGRGEISGVDGYLRGHLNTGHKILQLFGALDIGHQRAVLQRGKEPRIILSTNIAETSLTVEGITTVIDSGYCRRLRFDEATGLDKLLLEPVSKASAKQRAGRAGRLAPGRCFRLWSKEEQLFLQENEEPEILRADITSAVLQLLIWGCGDPREFGWFQNPGPQRIQKAMELLTLMGAVDPEGVPTPLGKAAAKLPTDPRPAVMLLSAAAKGCLKEAALAAAIMSEKDFLSQGGEGDNPDLEYRVQLLLSGKAPRNDAASRILQIAGQLEAAASAGLDKENLKGREPSLAPGERLRKAMLAAFPDRVAVSRGGGAFTLCAGTGLQLSQGSGLSKSEYILALKADSVLRTATASGKIFLACPINKDWLLNVPGNLCVSTHEVFFKEERGKVAARRRVRYGKLLISDIETSVEPQQREIASKVFAEAALKNLRKAFDLDNEEKINFLSKIALIGKSGFADKFPPIKEEWFARQLTGPLYGTTSFQELKKYRIRDLYFAELPYSSRELFDKLVPASFKLPDGREAKIHYSPDSPPVLAVKLQELFGQSETPSVCFGRVKLLIHLLSPSGRPVQITSDLNSFWDNGYKQIVGELRGRYPKHPWPDDPRSAVPTNKTNAWLRKHGNTSS